MGDEIRVAVTAFKARCLALIDDVAQGKTARVLLVKRGRVVAAVVPAGDAPRALWGALAGTVCVARGTDLTRGMGEAWDAEG
jgi:antitoxin (DNA-binding transcriptional repressor) of toxin-antitoxin stability system